MLALLACESSAPSAEAPVVHHESQPNATAAERSCAWYGDRHGRLLYFGESAFWSAFRAAGGDPRADLESPSPQQIGRFDLDVERLLEPLVVGEPDARSGVWDVLAHPNGWVYFTTFFELSGRVDPHTGRVERFESAGLGLNELALGPGERILATRYGNEAGDASGSLVVLHPDGRVLAEHPLRGTPGWLIAPKSVAYDPVWNEAWITSDRLPEPGRDEVAESPAPRGESRPTLVIGLDDGIEQQRIQSAEVQFVRFGGDGAGQLAVVENGSLWLAVFPADDPNRDWQRAPRILLERRFPETLDFVQELRVADDGRVVATRWSGRVHLVETLAGRPGSSRALQLPSLEDGGLYYTAVAFDDRVCATYCAGIRVVCAPAPGVLR